MRRSKNFELLSFDPDIEGTTRSLRLARRKHNQAMENHNKNASIPIPTLPQHQPQRTIQDYIQPATNQHYSGIVRQTPLS